MSVLRIRAFSRSQLVSLFGGTLVVALAFGCQRGNEPPAVAAQEPQEPVANPAPAPAQAPVAESSSEPGQAPSAVPAPIMVRDVGFKTPESVLYDDDQDVYLVSNVNGSPTETNGNGFISKLGPDGQVAELKWVDGGKPDVTLNAPKGMAVSGDKLYVTDITFVRIFDRKSGKPLGKIGAAGASFLNGIAAAPDGTIYVSDTGLKQGKDGLEPNGTDALYRIGPRGVAEVLIRGTELNRPNGLLADNEGLWVASYGSNELYRVSIKENEAKKGEVYKLPSGALDGLVQTSDGSILVASWEGSAVYRGTLGGAFAPLVQGVQAPADIGYDSKRNALLIPLFKSDAVQIQALGPQQPGASAARPAAQPKPSAAAPSGAQPAQRQPAQAASGSQAQPAPAQPPAASQPPAGAQAPAASQPPPAQAPAASQPPPAAAPAPQPKK